MCVFTYVRYDNQLAESLPLLGALVAMVCSENVGKWFGRPGLVLWLRLHDQNEFNYEKVTEKLNYTNQETR